METMNLDLINALTKVLTNYIDSQIDKKIASISTSNDELIRCIAQEEINNHCGSEDHKDESDIEDIIDNKIDDHDFSDVIERALSNYDLSDNIKQALNNVTINLSLD